MSTFLSKADYLYHLRTNRLDQILEEQDEDEEQILNDAENDAISIIRDSIGSKYNANQIFAASGDARHRTILRWAKVLVIYFIYERIPDEMVPERVVKNYNHVLERLRLVEEGEVNIEGAPVIQVPDENGENTPKTRRRWGSIPKRTNDGGSPRFLNR